MRSRIDRPGSGRSGLGWRALGSTLLVLGSVACAHAELLFAPDPNWVEEEAPPPPVLDRSQLRAFEVEAGNPNRHFIDLASLSVGADGVVRYVLVIVAAGGAENISYEGLRCASAQWRRYASAGTDGEWLPARRPTWQPTGLPGRNRPRAALAFDYFCDGPVGPRNREHALRLFSSPRRIGY